MEKEENRFAQTGLILTQTGLIVNGMTLNLPQVGQLAEGERSSARLLCATTISRRPLKNPLFGDGLYLDNATATGMTVSAT